MALLNQALLLDCEAFLLKVAPLLTQSAQFLLGALVSVAIKELLERIPGSLLSAALISLLRCRFVSNMF